MYFRGVSELTKTTGVFICLFVLMSPVYPLNQKCLASSEVDPEESFVGFRTNSVPSKLDCREGFKQASTDSKPEHCFVLVSLTI